MHAIPEGTAFFANEPILRVTAPLPEAQLIEARLINVLPFQSLIACKAARMVLAATNKLLVDFGCAVRTALKRVDGCAGKLHRRLRRHSDYHGRDYMMTLFLYRGRIVANGACPDVITNTFLSELFHL